MKIQANPTMVAGVALLVLAVAIWQYWRWRDLAFERFAISEFIAGRDIGFERKFGAGSSVRLAYAVYLAGRGRSDDARELLADLGERGEPEFRASALYNLGNLYLRRALAEVEHGGDAEKAVAPAELAKDCYRRALRADPRFADAKYNLEVATRLLPDFDSVDSGTEVPDEESARRLWTRVPGLPRGLP